MSRYSWNEPIQVALLYRRSFVEHRHRRRKAIDLTEWAEPMMPISMPSYEYCPQLVWWRWPSSPSPSWQTLESEQSIVRESWRLNATTVPTVKAAEAGKV